MLNSDIFPRSALTYISRSVYRYEHIGRSHDSDHCSFFKPFDSCEHADYLTCQHSFDHRLGGARPEKKRQFSSSTNGSSPQFLKALHSRAFFVI